MDSGFEALPARASGAHGRKRRLVTLGVAAVGGGGGGGAAAGGAAAGGAAAGGAAAGGAARAAHSYTVETDADIVAAEPAPFYDTAHAASAERLEDDQPGGVEGSGGLGKWEYLDHTADVQVHTCESPPRKKGGGCFPARDLTPRPPLPTQGATRCPRPLRSRLSGCGAT